jgi:chromate transporter
VAEAGAVTEVFDVFLAFARVGLLGFGGGPAMIPLIQAEAVDLHGWIGRAEFLDAFAFGNALPGPIATKLAGYIGFQVAGWPGAAAGLLGITGPTIVLIVALASLYRRYRERSVVQRFLYGVRPVVVALLALVVWDFLPTALAPGGLDAGDLPLWLIAIGALALSLRTKVHPALLIVVGGAIGWLL